ncbi:O-antigen ligase family protein [Brasilonema sp. CT11]|nr:O-antigen ligase family protein [Brasilonema sp. CT11]
MKIKIFYIPTFLAVSDLILSLPQLNLGVIGATRLVFLPLLVLVLIEQLRKVDEKRIRFAVSMSWPLLLLPILFLFQIVAIPPDAVPTHLSGCTKYIFWSLLYLSAVLSLNSQTTHLIRKILFITLLLVFIATIVQYPIVIQRSSQSLSSIIASYGTQEKDIFGLFSSANEDANSLMTLFPLALFSLKKKSDLKGLVFKVILLLYLPPLLFINGTRTALFITFPILLFLFHFTFSIKNFTRLAPFVIIFVLIYNLYVASFAESSFSKESEGEGTWGFRVERVWTPTSNYTSENSPIFGFGSRGWEYVCRINGIVRGAGEDNPFEVIPAHNVYVWTYVSWGIVGFSIYLGFLLTLLKESFQLSIFPQQEISLFGKTLFCCVIGYCIWASISNAYIEAGWDILFLIGILISSLKMTALLSKYRINVPSNQKVLQENSC